MPPIIPTDQTLMGLTESLRASRSLLNIVPQLSDQQLAWVAGAAIAVLAVRGMEADGKRPGFCCVGFGFGIEEEALLRYGTARATWMSKGEYGDAGLRDQAIHDLIDRLVAYFGLRIPEVFCRCVAI